MNLKDRVIHGVLNRLFQKRDIVIDGELYLRRWYVSGRGTDAQWFLHNIRKPDAGRDLHDHPWDFTTKILSGGYVEKIEDYNADGTSLYSGVMPRLPGDEVNHLATHTHRITYVQPGTYTLVKAGPARRTWGFWVSERVSKWTCRMVWKQWREYLGRPADEPDHPEDRVF